MSRHEDYVGAPSVKFEWKQQERIRCYKYGAEAGVLAPRRCENSQARTPCATVWEKVWRQPTDAPTATCCRAVFLKWTAIPPTLFCFERDRTDVIARMSDLDHQLNH